MDTDSRIFQELLAGFRHGLLGQCAQLRVDVRDGVVTISGRVNTFAQRKAVERIAKRVEGIRTLILDVGAAARPLSATEVFDVSRDAGAGALSG